MKIKTILAYTNPVCIICGIPLLVGIIIAVMTRNVARNSYNVVRRFAEDTIEKE